MQANGAPDATAQPQHVARPIEPKKAGHRQQEVRKLLPAAGNDARRASRTSRLLVRSTERFIPRLALAGQQPARTSCNVNSWLNHHDAVLGAVLAQPNQFETVEGEHAGERQSSVPSNQMPVRAYESSLPQADKEWSQLTALRAPLEPVDGAAKVAGDDGINLCRERAARRPTVVTTAQAPTSAIVPSPSAHLFVALPPIE